MSQRLGASEEFLGLGTGGEVFLRPAWLFESPGLGLLERRGDRHPPGVCMPMSGKWIENGGPATSFGSLGVNLLAGICFFASFGASQREGASEAIFGLGAGSEVLLIATAPLKLKGKGDCPPTRVGRLVLEVWVGNSNPNVS